MQTYQIKTSQEMSRFEDTQSIISYCHYLIMNGQLIGNLRFDGHRHGRQSSKKRGSKKKLLVLQFKRYASRLCCSRLRFIELV